ncbi:hypothetical protein [uncultured Tenacibaculum sp.]|uniref:hypothetical protein n=1 Tax=uncultured Tenacibaculum sp. TaxID=174713 RepID=UPI00261E83BA|nr:hypothetical protein [uncultured Tenacibaculum sp.]
MEDLILQNDVFINNLVFIANNVQSEISKLRINRLSDTLLSKHLDFYSEEIEKIKDLAVYNPRFKWQLIEHEIDSCFKSDKSITGVNIVFDWKDSQIPNRPLIKLKL